MKDKQQIIDNLIADGRADDVPADAKWIRFSYNGDSRFGLDLEQDGRPGTNNRVVMTTKGIRTFKVDNMENVRVLDQYWDD